MLLSGFQLRSAGSGKALPMSPEEVAARYAEAERETDDDPEFGDVEFGDPGYCDDDTGDSEDDAGEYGAEDDDGDADDQDNEDREAAGARDGGLSCAVADE
jgi:hypothetical protein